MGGDSGWSGHGYFASGRGGWKPPFHGYAVSFIKEEVWATIGRGTGPKAKAAEGNDEGRISPIDKPAVQFGSFMHLGYSFGGMSMQRMRRGWERRGTAFIAGYGIRSWGRLRRLFLLGEAGVDVDTPFDAVVSDDV